MLLSLGCGQTTSEAAPDGSNEAGAASAGASGGAVNASSSGGAPNGGVAGNSGAASPGVGGTPSAGARGMQSGGGSSGGAPSPAGGSGMSSAGMGSNPAARLVSLSFMPEALALTPGMQPALLVSGNYSDGQQLDVTLRAALSSSNPSVAEVRDGTVLAVSEGSAIVTATVDGISASLSVSVGPHAAIALSIRGLPSVAATNMSHIPSAYVTLSDGRTRVVSELVTWTSSDPRVALVVRPSHERYHVVEPLTPGETRIRATLGDLSAEVALSVSGEALSNFRVVGVPSVMHVGDSAAALLQAVVDPASGGSRFVRSSWVASELFQARSDVWGRGSFTASAVGVGSVSAILGGNEVATARVTVIDATLQSITIKPDKSEFAFYETPSIAAIGTYSDGSQYDITQLVEWTDPPRDTPRVVVIVNDAAVLNGWVLGPTTLSASLDGVTATTAVNVLLGAPDEVLIDGGFPLSLPLAVHGELQANAYRDAVSINVTEHAVWSVANPAVATLGPVEHGRMRLTGRQSDTTEVHIRLPGLVVPALPVTFTDAALVSIGIEPEQWTCLAGDTTFPSVHGTFDDGFTHDITRECSWRSSNPAVAAFDPPIATCVAPGTSSITASLGPLSASFAVTVQ